MFMHSTNTKKNEFEFDLNALYKTKKLWLYIIVDFSKTSDSAYHDILLKKQYHYGIHGYAYSWFQSYLTNRTHFVTYNCAKSKKIEIRCGVPQGSIIGPLLIVIYTNNLHTVHKRI